MGLEIKHYINSSRLRKIIEGTSFIEREVTDWMKENI